MQIKISQIAKFIASDKIIPKISEQIFLHLSETCDKINFMKIDFEKIPQNVIANFKGGEKNFIAKMYADSSIKIMRGRLEDGATIGFHKHENSSV